MVENPTRKQVALEAGVSEATVSRVYNQPRSVSPEKVNRVKRAAQKLNYIPNKYASALRRKGSGVILFLEKDSASGYQWTRMRHYNAFYAEIIRSLTRETEKTLYHLRLKTVTRDSEILKLANPKICDGVIGFNFESERSAELFQKSGLPYVCCHHTEGFKGVNTISTDNYEGGRIQAQALQNAGYCRPLYVTGALDETFAHRERLRGFRSIAGENLPVIQVTPTLAGGSEISDQLIKRILSKETDSIGVVNDLTAIGIIHKLMQGGVEIPRDVAIIGYDNLPVISALPFALTTVDLQLTGIYKKALRGLLDLMQGASQIKQRVKPILSLGDSV